MGSSLGSYNYVGRRPAKKRWRYPGVPIPWRLQGKYEVRR